jgi:hypothetical protein
VRGSWLPPVHAGALFNMSGFWFALALIVLKFAERDPSFFDVPRWLLGAELAAVGLDATMRNLIRSRFVQIWTNSDLVTGTGDNGGRRSGADGGSVREKRIRPMGPAIGEGQMHEAMACRDWRVTALTMEIDPGAHARKGDGDSCLHRASPSRKPFCITTRR